MGLSDSDHFPEPTEPKSVLGGARRSGFWKSISGFEGPENGAPSAPLTGSTVDAGAEGSHSAPLPAVGTGSTVAVTGVILPSSAAIVGVGASEDDAATDRLKDADADAEKAESDTDADEAGKAESLAAGAARALLASRRLMPKGRIMHWWFIYSQVATMRASEIGDEWFED